MSQSRHFAPEVLGPSFDTVGGEVQQPGTIRRGAPEGVMHIEHEGRRPPDKVNSFASDKFAIRGFLIPPDLTAHQLLPVDRTRKVARITVISTAASPAASVYIGTEADVMNFAGNQGAGFGFLPPNLYFVPPVVFQVNQAPPPVEYTSKGALWYCVTQTGAAGVLSLQMVVEHFEGGTPVT